MWKAFRAYGASISFLGKHNLAWFLFFPIIITILVVVGGFSLVSFVTETLSELLKAWLETSSWLPDWAQWLEDVLYWILWIVLRILLYFAFAFFGGTIILLLMAPILTWLSEKVAVKLEKDVPEFSITQFMRDLTRAAGLAIKNGLIQFGLTIVCFLIGFIPVVGVASPFLLFFINAYFFGYNFMDYTLERKQMTVRDSSRYVWNHKFTTLGIGTPFALWMLIPFIGPMTAGFVAIFATIAGTIELERRDDFRAIEPIA